MVIATNATVHQTKQLVLVREVHKVRFVTNFEDVFQNLTPPTLSPTDKKLRIIVSNFQYQLISK